MVVMMCALHGELGKVIGKSPSFTFALWTQKEIADYKKKKNLNKNQQLLVHQ